MPDNNQIVANVVNEQGKSLLVLKSISREGDKIKIVGSLLGQWDSVKYMEPDQLINAVQIVMNSPEFLSYVLDLPQIMKATLAAEKK
jgi:hypothetical protein